MFDVLTGQRTLIQGWNGLNSTHLDGGIVGNGPYLYGMSDDTHYPTQPQYSVYRWDLSAPNVANAQPAVTFDLADLTTNPKYNVETDLKPVSVGMNGNIVAAMDVNQGVGLVNQVLLWYDLNTNARKVCSLQTNDRYSFQIYDEATQVGLLFDAKAGSNVSPKYLHFADCSMTEVPNLQNLSHSYDGVHSYTEAFLTQKVSGRTVFFNNMHAVDAQNGKVLAQFCQ